jgi:hypothetical protein
MLVAEETVSKNLESMRRGNATEIQLVVYTDKNPLITEK